MELEYVTSQKGHSLLVHDNFTFRRERQQNKITYWKCTDYRIEKCKGRVIVVDGRIVKSTCHNHVAEPSKIQARAAINRIKRLARTTQEPTREIVASCSSSPDLDLPSASLLTRTIQRARQQSNHLPEPESLTELELPEEYTKTLKGQPFLLYDSGPSEDRILIFTTQRNLEILLQMKHWFAGGTSESVPHPFKELYTIHSIVKDSVIPQVFALLPSKSLSTYDRLWSTIEDLNPNMYPTSIATGFERNPIDAFKRTFPKTYRRGCFFHLSRPMWRKIQEIEGMEDMYWSDPRFSLQVRQLAALAYVPTTDVESSFETLLESAYYVENERLLRPLVDYFEDMWIGRITHRNRRRLPFCPMLSWNCYEAVKFGWPIAHYSVEDWHSGFSELFDSTNSTIWKYIDAIRNEHDIINSQFERCVAGGKHPQYRKVDENASRMIEYLVKDYESKDRLNFLRGISYNLRLETSMFSD